MTMVLKHTLVLPYVPSMSELRVYLHRSVILVVPVRPIGQGSVRAAALNLASKGVVANISKSTHCKHSKEIRWTKRHNAEEVRRPKPALAEGESTVRRPISEEIEPDV